MDFYLDNCHQHVQVLDSSLHYDDICKVNETTRIRSKHCHLGHFLLSYNLLHSTREKERQAAQYGIIAVWPTLCNIFACVSTLCNILHPPAY